MYDNTVSATMSHFLINPITFYFVCFVMVYIRMITKEHRLALTTFGVDLE
jgi:hypothetical protein